MHSPLAQTSRLEGPGACVPNRTSPHDLSHRACTGIDFPLTLVEALIFALALSVLSSLRHDAPPPALLAPT